MTAQSLYDLTRNVPDKGYAQRMGWKAGQAAERGCYVSPVRLEPEAQRLVDDAARKIAARDGMR